MSFNAHDLKVAFQDGREFENERILELLRNQVLYEGHNDNAKLEMQYYEKLFKL